MIEVVKDNPCIECGIKGLYEHCEDKCVQYRKWYQYQQGRANAIEEIENKVLEWDMNSNDGWIPCGQVTNWLEQLKEKNNG